MVQNADEAGPAFRFTNRGARYRCAVATLAQIRLRILRTIPDPKSHRTFVYTPRRPDAVPCGRSRPPHEACIVVKEFPNSGKHEEQFMKRPRTRRQQPTPSHLHARLGLTTSLG